MMREPGSTFAIRKSRRLAAAEERLIDLNIASEPVPARAHHHRAIAVQHRPCGLIRTEPHLALQLRRRDANLATGQVPRGREPHRQRRTCAMKDRARGRRDATVATSAAPPPVRRPPPSASTTPRTHETVRPAKPVQVVKTLPVLIEPRTQLRVGTWIITTRSRRHTQILRHRDGDPGVWI